MIQMKEILDEDEPLEVLPVLVLPMSFVTTLVGRVLEIQYFGRGADSVKKWFRLDVFLNECHSKLKHGELQRSVKIRSIQKFMIDQSHYHINTTAQIGQVVDSFHIELTQRESTWEVSYFASFSEYLLNSLRKSDSKGGVIGYDKNQLHAQP